MANGFFSCTREHVHQWMSALSARLHEASQGRLEVCEVSGYGRCICTVAKVARGELLVKEKPLVLGSSDGLCLAEVCVEGQDLDAADDLIASCILLETNAARDLQEARVVAGELASTENQSENLLPCLSDDVLETLAAHGSPSTILQRWRGICDINAETWAEFVDGPDGNIRFLFGLFGALALAEHSCHPNARAEWDEEEQAMRLVATEDIDAGQRVSRSYLDVGSLLSSASMRQDTLLRDWHFRCECCRCKDEVSGIRPFKGNDKGALAFLAALDLQRCVDTGLTLDEDFKEAVRAATSACAMYGLPAVGTLYFLQGVLARVGEGDLRILRLHFPSAEPSPKRGKVE